MEQEKPTAFNIPIIDIMDILYTYWGEGVTHVDIILKAERKVVIRRASKQDDDILDQLR